MRREAQIVGAMVRYWGYRLVGWLLDALSGLVDIAIDSLIAHRRRQMIVTLRRRYRDGRVIITDGVHVRLISTAQAKALARVMDRQQASVPLEPQTPDADRIIAAFEAQQKESS
jgi:hypothetical protein